MDKLIEALHYINNYSFESDYSDLIETALGTARLRDMKFVEYKKYGGGK